MSKQPTAERVRELFAYDPLTGLLKRRVGRGTARAGDVAGCVSSHRDGSKYIKVSIDNRMYQAHRVIWLHVYGNWPDGEIDHVDCNGLNNSLSNLRQATRCENIRNRGAPKSNTSGFKGVYLEAEKNKWRARIRINGKNIHLGYFADPEAAHAAYVNASKQFHGEFHFAGNSR